jgi:hypothetical protein
VEIGAEAALFPGKEYISGIFLAVHSTNLSSITVILISLYILNLIDTFAKKF